MTMDINNNAAATPNTPVPPATPPRGKDSIELYLPSVLGYEKIARRAAEAVAEQMDFKLDRIEDLKTAVAEACMNAIEHGNNFERDVNVSVNMTILPDKLEVRVADIGRQVVPDELPPPGSGDMRGWGFFFIQNLVDEMEINKLPEGGNEVRMVLYLKRKPAEKSAASTGEAAAAEEKPAASAPQGAAQPASGDKAAPAKPAEAASQPESGTAPDASSKAIQPAESKPSAVQPAPETPSAIKPAEAKSSAIQPAESKSNAIQPAEKKPSAVQAVPDQPRAVQPADATASNTAKQPPAAPPTPSESEGDESSPES